MHKQSKSCSSSSPKSPRSLMRLNLILLLSYLVVSSKVHSASIIERELDKSGIHTNSIQMQQLQQNQPQQSTQSDLKPQQIALNIDDIVTSTIQLANKSPATENQQQQAQTSPINTNNNSEQSDRPTSNMKADRLLKGLSNLMNPKLNPAAYFVPNSPSQSTLKSQHQREGNLRKSMMQKTDANNWADNIGGQQQMSAEPSALVNIQATGQGTVNAPTRMARPQNYIFRWGR